MLNKIAIVLLIIFLIFFLSNDKKMSIYTEKKNFKYLFIIFIFFCIYNDVNVLFIIIITLGFLYYNSNLYEKLKHNKILGSTIEKFANEYDFVPYNNNDNDNNDNNDNNNNDVNNPDINKFNIEKYKNSDEKINKDINEDNIDNENNKINDNKKNNEIEPFKLSVQEIKEMYDNIKLQLEKMDE